MVWLTDEVVRSEDLHGQRLTMVWAMSAALANMSQNPSGAESPMPNQCSGTSALQASLAGKMGVPPYPGRAAERLVIKCTQALLLVSRLSSSRFRLSLRVFQLGRNRGQDALHQLQRVWRATGD